MEALRTLASIIGPRAALSAALGKTFGGMRDLARVLGYKSSLDINDYRLCARRNPLGSRIIRAFPQGTWRGGGELIEDDEKQDYTPFEKQWHDLAVRLRLWRVFYRADVLAGLDRYSCILLGAPGALNTPLQDARGPEDLVYAKPYADDILTIEELESNSNDIRFGKPKMYRLKPPKLDKEVKVVNFPTLEDKMVHWTRVIHVCDDLEDDLYGSPRLECVWNRLDDLDKVTGGGAEAFWLRANQGIQVDVEKEIDLSTEAEKRLDEEVDRYIHEISRVLRTRGTTVNTLGSEVADFKNPVAAIIAQICSGTGIPQRILMGSERGELASTQDRDNWFDQIGDRRLQFAEPNLINVLTDRLIEFKFLGKPAQYETRWSQLKSLDDGQKADLAIKIATVNKYQGETVVTADEIRDRVFGYPKLTEEQKKEEAAKAAAKKPAFGQPPGQPGSRKNPALPEDANQVRAQQ